MAPMNLPLVLFQHNLHEHVQVKSSDAIVGGASLKIGSVMVQMTVGT